MTTNNSGGLISTNPATNPPLSSSSRTTLANRLVALKAMYDSGAITSWDFDDKKREIVQNFDKKN